MAEIAAASDEQSRGIQQVSLAVTEMDNVTQQNASLVEEASSAAASLEDQAGKLTQAVAVFRFLPEGPDADWDAFSEAAEAGGFEVSWYEAEGDEPECLEVETPPGVPSAAWIWSWEEPLILLGALHGFAAEGWGIEGV